MVDVWKTVHAERRVLADQLAGLAPAQWESATACADWTVRDVLAHLTATATTTPFTFFPKLIGSGFKLTAMQAKDVARERGTSSEDALARFTAIIDSSKHPPGPSDTWLGEVIVHGEDIRRAVGISHAPPMEAVVQVADSYKGSNLVIGAKRRIAGVRLAATDTDWTHGEGPAASGPMLSILLAMTGRKGALADLGGDGVSVLAARN
jgi:uncharacterized protein (TIGR03083 family)